MKRTAFKATRSPIVPSRSTSQLAATLEDSTAARIAQDFSTYPAADIFTRLLWTWPLRHEGRTDRDTVLFAGVENEEQWHKRTQQLEDRYGSKNAGQSTYNDRARLLRCAVVRLKRYAEEQEKPDLLKTVFTILLHARDKAQQISLDRFKLLSDRKHRIKWDHKTSADLVAALKARKACLQRTEPLARYSPKWHLIEKLLALEDSQDPPSPKLPTGRKKTEPVAAWARQALKKTGVPQGLPGFHQALNTAGCSKRPKNLPDAFLMAVGLIAYGSSRSKKHRPSASLVLPLLKTF